MQPRPMQETVNPEAPRRRLGNVVVDEVVMMFPISEPAVPRAPLTVT